MPTKRVLIIVAVVSVVIATVASSVVLFNSGIFGGKKEYYTAQEFLDDYDVNRMEFRSFNPGDTVKIRDVLTKIDGKDSVEGVFPFHLQTENDAKYYTFFVYIRSQATPNGTTAVEYVFSSDAALNTAHNIGDTLIIALKIIKENNTERFESPVDSALITKT